MTNKIGTKTTVKIKLKKFRDNSYTNNNKQREMIAKKVSKTFKQ